jgi:MFS-type transporter involved in bile tolerance (Atg22 family)
MLIIIIFALVFGPLLLIWSLNILFGLGIAYTFNTWLAALIIGATVGGSRGSRS